MYSFQTQRTCSKQINFDVVDGKVCKVHFDGGCMGNTQGVASLVEGMEVEEVISRLKGIQCGPRGTSCPDQLAQALELYLEQK
ncbi:MAG: TIGR03905 family TSCPD domain-containing protein [Anaerotardibacter sp.]